MCVYLLLPAAAHTQVDLVYSVKFKVLLLEGQFRTYLLPAALTRVTD
jgi:hypothetical protein